MLKKLTEILYKKSAKIQRQKVAIENACSWCFESVMVRYSERENVFNESNDEEDIISNAIGVTDVEKHDHV